MTTVETTILAFIEQIMMLILIHKIDKDLKTKWYQKVGYISFSISILALINTFVTNNVLNAMLAVFSFAVITIIYLKLFNESSIAKNLIIYMLMNIYVIIIELVSTVIMLLVVHSFTYTFGYGLISMSISMLITILIVIFLSLDSIYNYIESSNALFNVLVSTIYILNFFVVVFWHKDFDMVSNGIVIILGVTLFSISINTLLLRESLLSSAYKKRLDIYDVYFPIIDDVINEMRKKQHDFNNHIQTLIILSENNDQAGVQEYSEQISRGDLWQEFFKMDNKVLLAFLYSKYVQAHEKGVTLVFDIANYHIDSLYKDYQLVEIYGILIDNAIEAALRHNDDLEVSIYLSKENGKNKLTVRNCYEYTDSMKINQFFKNGYTTKRDESNGGVGLYKLKHMIIGNGGTISMYYDTSVNEVVAEILHK